MRRGLSWRRKINSYCAWKLPIRILSTRTRGSFCSPSAQTWWPKWKREDRVLRTDKVKSTRFRALLMAAGTLGLLAAAGCHTDMWVQPKPKPQSESDFFQDGVSSRPPIAHVVDRDHLKTDDAYWRGIKGTNMVNGKPAGAIFVDDLPAALYDAPEFKSENGDKAEELAKILDRGQERFNIFCSPCHGELGDGNGMIAKRGFSLKVPPRN